MAIEMIPDVTTTNPPFERIPPLANGDHLTLWEFERRYEAMPDVQAELVEGVVYMSSPVSIDHGDPHADLMLFLGMYRVATPGVALSDNTTVRFDLDNEVQPDAVLRIKPAAGGLSGETSKRYIKGAPELVVEIAVTSATYDLREKLNVYRRSGVPEYLVWQVFDKRVDWFRLQEGKYERLEPNSDGVIHSRIFPGLQLAVEKLLEGDLTAVLAELQKGIATAEHAALVERLQATEK